MCCCTVVFHSKEIRSKIRQHHTLNIHFIQLCLEINQSIPLQFTPEAAPRSFSQQLHGCPEPLTSHIPQPKLSEKGEKTRCTSWETIEVCSLIAAYRANYDQLRSTKTSHGNKSVWDSIMDDFLSLCSDASIESEKTLVQIKEKWRSLFDKFKAAKDHNNSDQLAAADPTTVADGEKTNDANDSPCRPKKKKKVSIADKEAESTILNLMEAQQAAIEKADEKDEGMLEALLKSQ